MRLARRILIPVPGGYRNRQTFDVAASNDGLERTDRLARSVPPDEGQHDDGDRAESWNEASRSGSGAPSEVGSCQVEEALNFMMYGAVHGIGDVGALSNKHVVLGLLIERPGYGYDVEQRFNSRFDFLSLSEKVVYKLLRQLETEGWIERVAVKQVGQTPPRVLYRVTTGGREEFSRWLADPCEISTAREEVHVKVVLAQPPDWPRVIELTDRLERTCLTAISELQRASTLTVDQLVDPEIPWDTVAAVLVDDAEVTRLQGMVDWLHRVRLLVMRRMNPPSTPSGRRA